MAMDIYGFINSRHTEGRCKTLGQTWTPAEMALIIGKSNCLAMERYAAWRGLIEHFPDMLTIPSSYAEYDSFRKKLSEVIEYENRTLALLEQPRNGESYCYKFYTAKDGQCGADELGTIPSFLQE